MMNPSKLHQTKHSTKGESKYKNKVLKSESKAQKPKRVHKGAKEQITF